MSTTIAAPRKKTKAGKASSSSKGTKATPKAAAKKKSPVKDLSASFNKFKNFNGKLYTGVQIGRGHHWTYDAIRIRRRRNWMRMIMRPKWPCEKGFCYELEISLNNDSMGIIRYGKSGWKMDLVKDQKLVDAIGEVISKWFEWGGRILGASGVCYLRGQW